MAALRKHEYQAPPDMDDPFKLSPHIATVEEGLELFDAEAQRTLGMSGPEFLLRWDTGEWLPVPDTEQGRKIMRLVMLMPFAGREVR